MVQERVFAQNDAALEPIRSLVDPVLGEDLAARIKTSSTGILHVSATWRRTFLAWFIDFLSVIMASVGVGAAIYNSSDAPEPTKLTVVTSFITVLISPWFYGWFFRNGRALGGWVAGTRLVRIKDGQRIGWTKAGWAMFIRVFFLPFMILTLLEDFDFHPVRISIDIQATEQLRQAGFTTATG